MLFIVIIKASDTATVNVTSSFKGKACSAVLEKETQVIHREHTGHIYNAWGDQYDTSTTAGTDAGLASFH